MWKSPKSLSAEHKGTEEWVSSASIASSLIASNYELLLDYDGSETLVVIVLEIPKAKQLPTEIYVKALDFIDSSRVGRGQGSVLAPKPISPF